MATPEEVTYHQEGPEVPTENDTSNPSANKVMNLTTDEEHMLEYDMLQQQIENGKYDGNGPADVIPVNQQA